MPKQANFAIKTTFTPIEGEEFEPFEFADVHFFYTEFNPANQLNSLSVAVFLKKDPNNGFWVSGRFIAAYIDFTNQLLQYATNN